MAPSLNVYPIATCLKKSAISNNSFLEACIRGSSPRIATSPSRYLSYIPTMFWWKSFPFQMSTPTKKYHKMYNIDTYQFIVKSPRNPCIEMLKKEKRYGINAISIERIPTSYFQCSIDCYVCKSIPVQQFSGTLISHSIILTTLDKKFIHKIVYTVDCSIIYV